VAGTIQATDSPPKPFNPQAKQFGNVLPVTTGSPKNPFLFSTTTSPPQPPHHQQQQFASPFNRNKFAPGFFDTPRQPTVESSDVDTPTSQGDFSTPADDSPPQHRTQYEKIRGRKPHDGVWKKRIQKSRKRMYLTGPSKYDSESEGVEEDENSPQTDVFALTKPGTAGSAGVVNYQQKATWTADPDLPYVASGYVQLVFNMFLVGVALYIGLAFIRTIQRDVDQKVEEYSAGISPHLCMVVDCDRDTAGNGSLFKRVSGESLCAKYPCPRHGKSLFSVGKVYEP
jgi:Di-sulfide bridge nucleocytoplasmic transport domain